MGADRAVAGAARAAAGKHTRGSGNTAGAPPFSEAPGG